jgi:hypothetical protein
VGIALVGAITASIAAWFVSSLDADRRSSAAHVDAVDRQRHTQPAAPDTDGSPARADGT